MIEFNNVHKRFDETVAADGINIVFPDGEISVLIGPSGCGKTTLMKMINRLENPDSGTVSINGSPVGERDPVELRRSIGYAIQEVGLFPHYTIYDNVALVPGLLKWPAAKTKERVMDYVNELDRKIMFS